MFFFDLPLPTGEEIEVFALFPFKNEKTGSICFPKFSFEISSKIISSFNHIEHLQHQEKRQESHKWESKWKSEQKSVGVKIRFGKIWALCTLCDVELCKHSSKIVCSFIFKPNMSEPIFYWWQDSLKEKTNNLFHSTKYLCKEKDYGWVKRLSKFFHKCFSKGFRGANLAKKSMMSSVLIKLSDIPQKAPAPQSYTLGLEHQCIAMMMIPKYFKSFKKLISEELFIKCTVIPTPEQVCLSVSLTNDHDHDPMARNSEWTFLI